ncbi:MAG: CDP-glycerol glycerophosphotransferase family protein [Patescibacteria group bacterium]
MRTILISSFNPFISRNLFCGDFLTGLKSASDTRVILIVPDYKKDFFEKNFGGGNVSVEGVVIVSPSRREVMFKYLASSLVWTRTIFIHKREKLAKDKKGLRFLSSLFLMAVGSLAIPRKICRALDYWLDKPEKFQALITKYSPSLIFATDVFNDDDVRLLHAAKSVGVPTVGMIRSWDNVTTKGLFRAKPSKLVVANEIIKKEAIGYCDMRAKDVSVVGLPQFDIYFKGGHQPREEFFKKINLDPNKKLIMFAPFGNRFWDLDWQILEILKKTGHQTLARMTPQDLVDLSKFQPASNTRIDWPGQRFHENKARDAELGQEDLQWLSDSLYYSDLVVTCGATLGMDAAVFDKPVIMVGFDGLEKRPYIKSVNRFLKFNHPQIVYRTGGFKVARSEKELHQMMEEYLKNPLLDQENRQKMIKEFCVYLDGKSGNRLGSYILGLVK